MSTQLHVEATGTVTAVACAAVDEETLDGMRLSTVPPIDGEMHCGTSSFVHIIAGKSG